MRRSELLSLTWDDIDLEAGTIRIRSENAKTARERRVPMTPGLSGQLRAIRSQQRVVRGPVFRTREGRAMTPKALQLRWKSALGAWKEAHENLRFHDLRHSAVSLMVNSGVDLYVVGQILGHSSAQTTKRYAHLILDRQREAVSALGASLLLGEKATG